MDAAEGQRQLLQAVGRCGGGHVGFLSKVHALAVLDGQPLQLPQLVQGDGNDTKSCKRQLCQLHHAQQLYGQEGGGHSVPAHHGDCFRCQSQCLEQLKDMHKALLA